MKRKTGFVLCLILILALAAGTTVLAGVVYGTAKAARDAGRQVIGEDILRDGMDEDHDHVLRDDLNEFLEAGEAFLVEEVSLREGEAFRVEMKVNASERCRITVDLYSDSYDDAAQELEFALDKGENDCTGTVFYEKPHPEACLFRCFTQDEEEIEILSLRVDRLGEAVPLWFMPVVLVTAAGAALTALAAWVMGRLAAVGENDKNGKISKNNEAGSAEHAESAAPAYKE